MKRKLLRNIFITVGVFFALTRFLDAGTSEGVSNFSNTPQVFPQATYTTFDIPNALDVEPSGINPAGIITGTSVVGSFPNILFHGFLRMRNGTITTLDAPGAGTGPFQGTRVGVFGFAGPPINPAGVITGQFSDANGVPHGFLRAPDGTFTTVDAPGAIGGTGFLCCITPSRAVAGVAFDANFVFHSFLRAPNGTFTTFDPPGAVFGSQPTGITPAGAITGFYADANIVFHGYLRAPDGTITTFDAPGAGTGPFEGTQPNGINPAGAITGFYVDTNFVEHGFLRAPDGTITTFDAPGAVEFGTNPIGNNPQGAITGWDFHGFTFHGFLRVPDGTITNVDPPGSVSTFPNVINPAGVITGEFFDATGTGHGFVRIP